MQDHFVFLSLDTIKNKNIKTNSFARASLQRAILERLNKDNFNEIK